jgi:integrase
MAKFAKNVDPVAVAKTQAANVMKQMQGSVISSVGTVRNFEQSLSKIAQYANQTLCCGLKEITPQQAHEYLTDRAVEVGQSQLNMERQALQKMMQHVSNKLEPNEKLEVVHSEKEQIKDSRSYTAEQVQIVADSQNDRNSLSTEIAYAAGLRAHELHTIRPVDERQPDERPASDAKFSGRDGERYTVVGKGGLVREIQLPKELSDRLEAHRLDTPQSVLDRGVNYQSHYDIAGGKNWSNSFSAASNRSLNWSRGAHGLRHSYAQERMSELQERFTRDEALEIVSQEMGHFRPEITEVYLR